MIFCPRRTVSTIGSINFGFCSRLVLSTWKYVNKGLFLLQIMSTWHSVPLGVCLYSSCPLGSLATTHSAHVGLSLLMVLSTLNCANFWLGLLGSPSNRVFGYLDSVHLGFWPHGILPTKECVH